MQFSASDNIENEISRVVWNICLQMHRELGPGLFESVYEEILFSELQNWGFELERQKTIPIKFRDREFGKAFKADIIVADLVILEIKSVEAINEVHIAQMITYLKISNCKLGYVINFNTVKLQNGIRRIIL